MHLKLGYCMLIHFIHGYYCIYRPWQPLTYLYFPYCISLIYFSFTKIRMFLYAQIYWLAEFGDVSCLQFNYLRVETHSDLGGFCRTCPTKLSDNYKSEDRQNSVSVLRVWSLIHLEGSVLVIYTPDKTKKRKSLKYTEILDLCWTDTNTPFDMEILP